MDMNRYQQRAIETRQVPANDVQPVMMSLLGLAGESGQLLSEYKKFLRDGQSHTLHHARVSEELGDLLWYIASVADHFDLVLSDVAVENLRKIEERWGAKRKDSAATRVRRRFDADYPKAEQLPREGIAEIRPAATDGHRRAETVINGQKMGEDLTDNAPTEDGYRFHDVFHLACMTHLGWSPVVRRGLGVKRKSDTDVDEIEDGGRAIVIEEGVSALVFSYAIRHKMLAGISTIDYSLLRTIHEMVNHLEVSARTIWDWERAILDGYSAWRRVSQHNGGRIRFNAAGPIFQFVGPLVSPA